MYTLRTNGYGIMVINGHKLEGKVYAMIAARLVCLV